MFVELLAISGSKGCPFTMLKIWDWASIKILFTQTVNMLLYLTRKEGGKSTRQNKTYDKGSERTLLSDGSLFKLSRVTCWSRQRMRCLLMLYADQDIHCPIHVVCNERKEYLTSTAFICITRGKKSLFYAIRKHVLCTEEYIQLKLHPYQKTRLSQA